jgi:hypothetical protein
MVLTLLIVALAGTLVSFANSRKRAGGGNPAQPTISRWAETPSTLSSTKSSCWRASNTSLTASGFRGDSTECRWTLVTIRSYDATAPGGSR